MSDYAGPNFADTLERRRLSRAGYGAFVVVLAIAACWSALQVDPFTDTVTAHLAEADTLAAESPDRWSDWLTPAAPRVSSGWLGQLGMRAVCDLDGFSAAVLATAMARAAFVVLLAAACWRAEAALPACDRFLPPLAVQGDRPYSRRAPFSVAAVATALGTFAALPHILFVPQTAAVLGMGAVIVLLLRDRARCEQTGVVWTVPVIALVSINLHPLALLMPVWIAAMLAGAVWERSKRIQPPERPEADRRVCRYARLLLATLAACAATPSLVDTLRQASIIATEAVGPLTPFVHWIQAAPAGVVAMVVVVAFLSVAILHRVRVFQPLRAGERVALAATVLLCWHEASLRPLLAMAVMPMLTVLCGKIVWPSRPRRAARAALAGSAAVAAAVIALLTFMPRSSLAPNATGGVLRSSAMPQTSPASPVEAQPASSHGMSAVSGLDRN
jgi:hypothetical protein